MLSPRLVSVSIDSSCSLLALGVPWEAGWSGLESGAGGESGDRMGDPPGTLPLEDDEALSVTTSFHELATDPLVLLAWHASPVCRVGSFFSNRFSNMGWTSPSAGSSASSPPVRLRSAASASKMRRASSSSGQPCSVLPPELVVLLPLPAADGLLLLLLLVVLIATPFPDSCSCGWWALPADPCGLAERLEVVGAQPLSRGPSSLLASVERALRLAPVESSPASAAALRFLPDS